MVEVVNVVTSGSLGTEIDLTVLAEDLSDSIEYWPEKYPAAYVNLAEEAPHITLYRTGKYIITGADSTDVAEEYRRQFLNLLSDCGVLPDPADEWFSVQNLVCTANAGTHFNLSVLAVNLGLEYAEYEPEQFAGLVYRPPDFDCVLLIMSSGKVIITGTDSFDTVNAAFESFKSEIDARDKD